MAAIKLNYSPFNININFSENEKFSNTNTQKCL